MTSVGRAIGVPGRLLARPRGSHDEFVYCSVDGFWFRPAYTDGRCPLCGDVVPGGAPPPPLLARVDRAWLGLAALALVSMAMSALVLLMYFKG